MPHGLKHVFAGILYLRPELFVIAEEPSCLLAKSHLAGSRESSEVYHLLRFELLLHIGHGIGQDQPPLSVGVSYFNSEPLHARDDVAWLEHFAADRVLREAHGKNEVLLWLQL